MKHGVWVLALLAVAVVAVTPWFGAESIDMSRAWTEWRTGDLGRDGRILSLRLPRALLAAVAGGCLAVVGAVFQTLLRNALATPYTLGVSFAGALGAFVALSVPAFGFALGPLTSTVLFAFAFAAADVFLLLGIARRRTGLEANELLLAGVTLNFFFGAAILLVRFLTDPLRLRAMDRWMMGGLQVSGWSELVALPLLVVPALGWIGSRQRALDQLSFGDEVASSRGVDVARTQVGLLLVASLLTAAVVSITGPIGFVGLLAPHGARRVVGASHRKLLPSAFLVGAALLAAADAAARSLSVFGRGAELPVGILTAIGGAPLFLLLLRRSRAR